jgi:hypothetical protein
MVLDATRTLPNASAAARALVNGNSLDFGVEPPAPLAEQEVLDEPLAPVPTVAAASLPEEQLDADGEAGPGVVAWSAAGVGVAAHLVG